MSRPHPRAARPAERALARLLVLGLLSAPVALADTAGNAVLEVPNAPAALAPEKARALQEAGRDLIAIDPGSLQRPGWEAPPRTHAMSCATPQSIGTIQATHPYYDVFLDAGGGSFTARTGASHSVTALAGSPQNVIYGGSGASPGTSDVSWRFHVQDVTYTDPGTDPTTRPQACVFDPPDTAVEPNSIGIEQEFIVSPEPGITCTLRQEIVAFGTTEADSGVRLTLSTTNSAASSTYVVVGVRWQIDYQNTSDDGPLFATVLCDPPVVETEWNLEHELRPSEIRDFYRIQNNSGSPIFSNVTSTTSISGIPNTGAPDRLVYGRWGAMVGSAWDYLTSEGGCCPDSDSAVLWYHGYLPADADMLQPGESSRHTIVIFSSPDRVDCGVFVPTCATNVAFTPASQTICAGDSATLDASGISLTDCAGTVETTWTDGTSIWTSQAITVSPATTTTYDVAVTCSTDPACRADYAATVTVVQAPQFDPPIAVDEDPCNGGIKLAWNAATFLGPSGSGTYNVYRSELSCADAVTRAPIASGLRMPGFFDMSTARGATYFYVVEAEDMSPGSPCAPLGPANGGAVTRLCATPIGDGTDDTLPAGVGPVLFGSHAGDRVTFTWASARPLLSGEHFHLFKAWEDPRDPFVQVNPELDTSLGFTETDTTSWLQFFDLRVADSCESVSLPDYPPGYDR